MLIVHDLKLRVFCFELIYHPLYSQGVVGQL